jgi:hypothetical protein
MRSTSKETLTSDTAANVDISVHRSEGAASGSLVAFAVLRKVTREIGAILVVLSRTSANRPRLD